MTQFNFPSVPADGDTYSAGGKAWTFNSASGVWLATKTDSLTGADLATAAQWLANTPDKVLSTGPIWTSAEKVVLTDATTIAADLSTFINATVTVAGNRTLGNPTNVKEGQTGAIEIKQDGTGGRTLAFGSNWKFAAGVAPALSTAANARDVLFYQVLSPTEILGALSRGVA